MMDGGGGGEQGDGRAKMAFAKMQIPAEVREAHLLVDADFDVKDENSDTIGGESSMEFVDANGGVVGLGGHGSIHLLHPGARDKVGQPKIIPDATGLPTDGNNE